MQSFYANQLFSIKISVYDDIFYTDDVRENKRYRKIIRNSYKIFKISWNNCLFHIDTVDGIAIMVCMHTSQIRRYYLIVNYYLQCRDSLNRYQPYQLGRLHQNLSFQVMAATDQMDIVDRLILWMTVKKLIAFKKRFKKIL